MLKLCYLCSEYPPGPHGGIGTYTHVLAHAMVERGHSVRVVGMYREDFPGETTGQDDGVQVWRLRVSPYRFSWVKERYRLFREVAGWTRKKEIDLVEAPDWGGMTAYWPRLSVPVVSRLHGSASYFSHEQQRVPPGSTARFEGSALRRADFSSSVSQYTADVTRRIFRLSGHAPAVIYNPVPLPPSIAPFGARSATRVVYTGTLTEKKGIISLIDGWPLVNRPRPDAELHIFGKDGTAPGGESMQRFLTNRLPAECRGSVTFHGHVTRPQVFDALSGARVGVFPSYSESFGLGPVEAMASGCPTIYTTLSCGPEIVRDGVDGLLVNPHKPQEIAASILRVLSNDQLAARLSEAGHQAVKSRFSIEAIAPQCETFYQACITRFGNNEYPSN